MENQYDKVCAFQDSTEIDLDFEFDVAKFFDFTRTETAEEVEESELWFDYAQGHPDSPLVAKVSCGMDESSENGTSSPIYGNQSMCSVNTDSDLCGASGVSSLDSGKKGQHILKSKLKFSSHKCSPSISRLCKPTASLLAKQKKQTGHSTRIPGRLQKLGSPVKSPADGDATKRQKLENRYLRKVAHLRHQAIFSHKTPKKGCANDVNANARPKATIPKEPALTTAQRAQRHRSNNPGQPGKDSKSNRCCTDASSQEKCDVDYKFEAHPFKKKIFSSKGDRGVLRIIKQEATVPKEFKLSSSKKVTQKPPIELFGKLSLNSENHPSSLPEQKRSLQTKGSKNTTSSAVMKENKIPNTITGTSMTSCLKQSQSRGGNMMVDITNHCTIARSFVIH